MRKIFIFLLAICMSFSATADDLVHQAEYDHLTQVLGTHRDMIQKSSMVDIQEKIQVMNPGLWDEVKDKTEEQQLVAFRNWLAVESFKYYKDYLMELLEQKSKETGRKIKKYVYETAASDDRYWLDNGKLDEPDCYNTEKRLACDYPDGFIECSLSINDHDPYDGSFADSRLVRYICDEPENDIRQEYTIWLLVNKQTTDVDNLSLSIHLDISSAETNYTRWHQWRNQDAADVRAGMWECDPEPDSWGSYWCEVKEPEKWKSSIIPGERFKMKKFDFSSNTWR